MGDTYLDRAILYRENEDLSSQAQPVNLRSILKGGGKEIELKKNDRLYVPSINELKDELFVTLEGEVKRPARYPYAINLSIADLTLQGGGLLESASRARIDVSRRIKNSLSTIETTVQSEVFSFTLDNGLIISGDKEFTLKPFDIINVRRSPGYEVQQNVFIRGEALFPGSYAKITRDERISSIVKRAGGLTSSAYIKGVRLTRVMNANEKACVESSLKLAKTSAKDSIMVDSFNIGSIYYFGIDLEKAIANRGGDEDIVLRAGDIIDVPTYNGTVKISGAVMYPNAVTYVKGMSIGDYISNAVGYSFKAKKSRVFVVYMNGKVTKRSNVPNRTGM